MAMIAAMARVLSAENNDGDGNGDWLGGGDGEKDGDWGGDGEKDGGEGATKTTTWGRAG